MAGKTATVLGRWDFEGRDFAAVWSMSKISRDFDLKKKILEWLPWLWNLLLCIGAEILRSNLNGMPMAQMLLSMDATVTTCHSKTANVEQHLRNADIVAWHETDIVVR